LFPQPKISVPAASSSINGPGFSEADYAGFQQRVERKTGIRLAEYKADQMRRRIASLAEKAGCVSFSDYAVLVERAPARLSEFLDRMTINVTEMLRNPNRFEELRTAVLPDLFARRKGTPLAVWSAGCSYGAEAYTLAMLLHEATPTVPHRIKGTDIDLAILAKADRPSFSPADMVNISPERRQAHFHEICDTYQPKMHLRNRCLFGAHDLLAGPYPRAEYDLILCRNVLIYFKDDAKERIYRGFQAALRPGGVLFVGGTERMTDHRAAGFELIQPFFYRKP
jgi:chemotaxis protein methyltransferase CheR